MPLLVIIFITIGLISYGIYEYFLHQKYLKTIPIRIHVNGTRGKSSVTRLIGAGLRFGGYSTITKVTGTFPRMILADGTEVVVHRKEKANILEQLKIVKFCSKEKADVLLIECMALQPIYQKITEHQMIKATHGIITNIRLDHLDVMGPRLENVAEALSQTIPKNSLLFTSEDRILDFLEKKAEKMHTKVIATDPSTVSKKEMEGFTYIEHPENVALALAICESLNVDRKEALAAMKKTAPDEGALTRATILHHGIDICYYNALAANDPESSVMLWNNIGKIHGENVKYSIIINSRKDRKERSEQLIEAAATLNFDKLFLTGENVDLVRTMGLKKDIDSNKIILIGLGDSKNQFEKILAEHNTDSIIVAFGNMGAGGVELAHEFERNQKNTKKW